MKSLSIVLFSTLVLLLNGCGSTKVAHATMVNTGKSAKYVQNQNSFKQQKHTLSTVITEAQKREFLSQINQFRAKRVSCGKYGTMGPAKPLAWSDKLYDAAHAHSYDMAKSSHFGHNGSGTKYDKAAQDMELGRGSKLKERMSYTNYRWRAIGENIAAGQPSIEAAMQAWIKSEKHCQNLMSDLFTEVGVAYYPSNDIYGSYWSQNFGTRL